MDALSTILLLLCAASYISHFLLPYLGMVSYLLRVPSSVQQSCATLGKYVVCVLFFVSFVSSLISEFLCFRTFSISRSSYSRVAFLLCSAPGTLALDLPILILSRLWFFSVLLSVTT